MAPTQNKTPETNKKLDAATQPLAEPPVPDVITGAACPAR
jgi:hypothetical protein